MSDVTEYICDSCGEAITLAVDLTAGEAQEFVEDCPVCCRPNVIQVHFDADGQAAASARREQD